MTRYAILTEMYVGDTSPMFRFLFDASTVEEAETLGFKWERYHSLSSNSVHVREASAAESGYETHNDWLR